MKFKLFAVTLLLFNYLFNASVWAQESQASPSVNASMERFCKKQPCRGKTVIRLKTNGEEFYDEVPMFWPVIQEGAISILPGEELFIEAELKGRRLVNLVHVPENTNPDKTLVLKFEQNDTTVAMMLSLSNPFDQAVKFNIQMMDFDGEFHQTSSCPVLGNAAVYESWPHPILQLIISNPRLLQADAEMDCEY